MLTLNQMQVNSKWIKDLNTRENYCKKSFMTLDPTIISWTPQEQAVKEETNKLNYTKIKTNCVRGCNSENATHWTQIFQCHNY